MRSAGNEKETQKTRERCSLAVSPPQRFGRLKVLQGSCVSVGWGLGIIIQFITGLSL